MPLQLLKRNKVIEILIPRFKELSVENIWPLVKDAEDLNEYFPDYNPNQLPERSYMFSIWATLRYEELKIMVENARRNRALEVKDEGNELVYINKELWDEIKGVQSQKRKRNINLMSYSFKG